MAPKRKATKKEELSDEELEASPAPKAKKPRAPKKPKAEPLTGEQADKLQHWKIHDTLLYRFPEGEDLAAPNKKIAAFDFDGTLVTQKSQARVPRDENDFKLFNKAVPQKLEELQEQGFRIVIFSNQNTIKSALEGKASVKARLRMENVLAEIGLDGISVFFAPQQDKYRKPEPGMWQFLTSQLNGEFTDDKVSRKASFFVGDAAGRKLDFADSDKQFAANNNLTFKTPEEVFGPGVAKANVSHMELPEGTIGPNAAMADLFQELSTLQENVFAQRANEKVAKIIRNWATKINVPADIKGVAGIGKGTLDKIKEILETGTMAALTSGGACGSRGDSPKPGLDSKNHELAMKFI